MLVTVKKKVLLSSAFLGVEDMVVHEYQALALACIIYFEKEKSQKGTNCCPDIIPKA